MALRPSRNIWKNIPTLSKTAEDTRFPKIFTTSFRKRCPSLRRKPQKGQPVHINAGNGSIRFFSENDIDPKDIEPAIPKYSEVQSGKINDTIQNEERGIRNEDQSRRYKAYEASKPSLKQGAQATALSAAAEGGIAFCLGVQRKRKQGKRLSEFTEEDWKDVGIDTTKGTAKGGIRGAALYAMTNFTATPAAVANALLTASFGIVAQAGQLRKGTITEEEFIINSEVLCLDVTISAVSSLLGQMLIPVPILGAVIGNVAGMFMYQIVKDNLSRKEEDLVKQYKDSFAALKQSLKERYDRLISHLEKELKRFSSMLELAFDPDVNIAFDGSIALADHSGVAREQVLRSKTDIDHYFLN